MALGAVAEVDAAVTTALVVVAVPMTVVAGLLLAAGGRGRLAGFAAECAIGEHSQALVSGAGLLPLLVLVVCVLRLLTVDVLRRWENGVDGSGGGDGDGGRAGVLLRLNSGTVAFGLATKLVGLGLGLWMLLKWLCFLWSIMSGFIRYSGGVAMIDDERLLSSSASVQDPAVTVSPFCTAASRAATFAAGRFADTGVDL